MKCAIVVLAACGLSAAAPEADPQQLLLNPAAVLPARAALFNPFFRSQVVSTLPAPAPVAAVNALPLPAPVVPTLNALPALPISQTPAATVIAPQAHPLSAVAPGRDCATLEGCAVRSLINSGVAVSRHARAAEPEAEAEAEAEADPQLLAYNNLALSPYAAYSGLYNPYSYGVYNNVALNYNLGYAAGAPLLNYAAAPAVAAPAPAAAAPAVAAPAVAAPAVAAPVVAAPAPLVKTVAAPVVAAPAPLVKTVAAPVVAPAPIVRTVAAAPVPVVRAPVVETEVKKVTYTHIGKHPVHPTDVFETKQRVVY